MTFAEIMPLLFLGLITVGIGIGIFFAQRRHWRRKALLCNRPQVASRNFGTKFYRDHKQAELASRLRDMLAKNLEISLDGLRPTDRLKEDLLFDLWSDPDFFWDLEKEFGIKTEIDDDDDEGYERLQQVFKQLATFHDVVCYVEGKLGATQCKAQ